MPVGHGVPPPFWGGGCGPRSPRRRASSESPIREGQTGRRVVPELVGAELVLNSPHKNVHAVSHPTLGRSYHLNSPWPVLQVWQASRNLGKRWSQATRPISIKMVRALHGKHHPGPPRGGTPAPMQTIRDHKCGQCACAPTRQICPVVTLVMH